MPLLILLAGLWIASAAHAQDLAGTYAIQGQSGPIVVRIQVSGARLIGTLEAPDSNTIVLQGSVTGGHARGTITAVGGSGEFEAGVEGDTLRLTLSQQAGPGQEAITLPLQLQRIDPSVGAAPGGDPPAPGAGPPVQGAGGDARLVGVWVSQDLITSGSASMASDLFLVFDADGSYAYGKGRAVAGGSNWSYEGGGGATERGRWRAEEGALYLAAQSGEWKRVGRYGMTDDGQTMRIIYEAGGRRLWQRRR